MIKFIYVPSELERAASAAFAVEISVIDPAPTHSELAQMFEQFLKAVGYEFESGLYSGDGEE